MSQGFEATHAGRRDILAVPCRGEIEAECHAVFSGDLDNLRYIR